MSACTGNPFDADSVSNFEVRGLGARAEFDYPADSLVAAHLAWLGWEGEEAPCIGHDTEVGVTDAGMSAAFVSVFAIDTLQ